MTWLRWHTPDCPCCECSHCFEVEGCCTLQTGVDVRVYETAVPGTTLASGSTDANGRICFDLSAHQFKALSVGTTKGDFAPGGGAFSLACDGTTRLLMLPKVETGGTSGRLTLSMVDCDNTTAGITGKQIGAYRTSTPTVLLQSKTFTSSGVVVFDGLPTGESLFVGGLNFESFPSFTLECEGSATARTTESGFCSQQWSFEGIPCGGQSWLCCLKCGNPLPPRLCLTDPDGPEGNGEFDSGAAVNCATASFEIGIDGQLQLTNCRTSWVGISRNSNAFGSTLVNTVTAVNYTMLCGVPPLTSLDPDLYLQVYRRFDCPFEGYYGEPGFCQGEHTSEWVKAATVTCDPFVATFPMPSYELECYRLGPPISLAYTRFFNGRTITVNLCP